MNIPVELARTPKTWMAPSSKRGSQSRLKQSGESEYFALDKLVREPVCDYTKVDRLSKFATIACDKRYS